jgi:signal transduction histidine kinase
MKIKMAHVLRDRVFWYLVVLTGLISGLSFTADLPTLGSLDPSSDWELAYTNIMRILFLATVAMATWRFGIRGGLISYLTILIIGLPYTIETTKDLWRPHFLLDVGIIAAIGAAFIWLIGREKEGRRLLEQNAEELRQQAHKQNREITERKRAEAALLELDQMKSQFISSVSHELRTPLHSIAGFTKLMLQGRVVAPKDQREFLVIIDKQSEHLGKLIDGLLDVSRLESGRFETRKQRLSIKEPIQDVINELSSLASEKGVVIRENVPSTLPEVEIDRERMTQVMTNLIGNAIKFNSKGSDIIIEAEVRGSEILVRVIDHGTGISKEAIPHIFEKFYRAKGMLSVGGTGLGLYITKQIVEVHGGRIWAESEPNKGSTFFFTIPKPLKKRTKRVGKILVEDGLITQQSLEEALKKQWDLEAESPGGLNDISGRGDDSYE